MSSESLSAPGVTPEEGVRLAREVALSIEFVGQRSRDHGVPQLLESKDPERAAAVLTMLARGESERAVIAEHNVGKGTMTRMRVHHSELLESTRSYRTQMASHLQVKASQALEKKLDRVLSDEEALDKTTVKDLSFGYGITTDKQRIILGESVATPQERKVTINDAIELIEAAKRQVEADGKVIEV